MSTSKSTAKFCLLSGEDKVMGEFRPLLFMITWKVKERVLDCSSLVAPLHRTLFLHNIGLLSPICLSQTFHHITALAAKGGNHSNPNISTHTNEHNRCPVTYAKTVELLCTNWLESTRYNPIALLESLDPVMNEWVCKEVSRVLLSVPPWRYSFASSAKCRH